MLLYYVKLNYSNLYHSGSLFNKRNKIKRVLLLYQSPAAFLLSVPRCWQPALADLCLCLFFLAIQIFSKWSSDSPCFLLFSKPFIIDKCVKCVPSDLFDINVPNVSVALRHNKPILCWSPFLWQSFICVPKNDDVIYEQPEYLGHILWLFYFCYIKMTQVRRR